MKVVLLAGGLGTRLREETEYRPKPMVEIGSKPILWHIMMNFGVCGYTDFVVCVGYKGEVIKDYFSNYKTRNNDFTIDLTSGTIQTHDDHVDAQTNWTVTVCDTGFSTPTGGRIKKVSQHLSQTFIVTYGDGLANVDINQLLSFHKSHGRLATVTTVKSPSRFGIMQTDSLNLVTEFHEKPLSSDQINAGFFVFESRVLDYIDFDSVLEQEPLQRLVQEGQLAAYQHEGYWQPMDTYREYMALNESWNTGNAPWKMW